MLDGAYIGKDRSWLRTTTVVATIMLAMKIEAQVRQNLPSRRSFLWTVSSLTPCESQTWSTHDHLIPDEKNRRLGEKFVSWTAQWR
jgi:hypothetical protein